VSGGLTVGALVGGTLAGLLRWRATFFVNVGTLLTTPVLISESTVSVRVKRDRPGAVTVTGGLLALSYGIIESSMARTVAGVLLLAAFWAIEPRLAAPLASVVLIWFGLRPRGLALAAVPVLTLTDEKEPPTLKRPA
jgi:hypothetical protein